MPNNLTPRLMLDNTHVLYEVADDPEPKLDLGSRTPTQKIDRMTELPMWTVALYARGRAAGKRWNAVMNVTVLSKDKPAVTEGEQVIPVDLEAMPWTNERKDRDGGSRVSSGVSFVCNDLRRVNAPDTAAELSAAI